MIEQILNWLFSEYKQKNIKFCILRNYQSLPEKNDGHDIDIIIDQSRISDNEKILKCMCEEFGFQCIRVIKRQFVHNWFFYHKEYPTKVLQLDFQFCGEWNGVIYLDNQEIIHSIVPYKNFYIPAPEHENLITLFASLLWGGFVKEKYLSHMSYLAKQSEGKYEQLVKSVVGGTTIEIERILIPDVEFCQNIVTKIRDAVKQNYVERVGYLTFIKRKIEFYLYEIRMCLHTPGLFVNIVDNQGNLHQKDIETILLPAVDEFCNLKFQKWIGASADIKFDTNKIPQRAKMNNSVKYYTKLLKPLKKMGVVVSKNYKYGFLGGRPDITLINQEDKLYLEDGREATIDTLTEEILSVLTKRRQ